MHFPNCRRQSQLTTRSTTSTSTVSRSLASHVKRLIQQFEKLESHLEDRRFARREKKRNAALNAPPKRNFLRAVGSNDLASMISHLNQPEAEQREKLIAEPVVHNLLPYQRIRKTKRKSAASTLVTDDWHHMLANPPVLDHNGSIALSIQPGCIVPRVSLVTLDSMETTVNTPGTGMRGKQLTPAEPSSTHNSLCRVSSSTSSDTVRVDQRQQVSMTTAFADALPAAIDPAVQALGACGELGSLPLSLGCLSEVSWRRSLEADSGISGLGGGRVQGVEVKNEARDGARIPEAGIPEAGIPEAGTPEAVPGSRVLQAKTQDGKVREESLRSMTKANKSRASLASISDSWSFDKTNSPSRQSRICTSISKSNGQADLGITFAADDPPSLDSDSNASTAENKENERENMISSSTFNPKALLSLQRQSSRSIIIASENSIFQYGPPRYRRQTWTPRSFCAPPDITVRSTVSAPKHSLESKRSIYTIDLDASRASATPDQILGLAKIKLEKRTSFDESDVARGSGLLSLAQGSVGAMATITARTGTMMTPVQDRSCSPASTCCDAFYTPGLRSWTSGADSPRKQLRRSSPHPPETPQQTPDRLVAFYTPASRTNLLDDTPLASSMPPPSVPTRNSAHREATPASLLLPPPSYSTPPLPFPLSAHSLPHLIPPSPPTTKDRLSYSTTSYTSASISISTSNTSIGTIATSPSLSSSTPHLRSTSPPLPLLSTPETLSFAEICDSLLRIDTCPRAPTVLHKALDAAATSLTTYETAEAAFGLGFNGGEGGVGGGGTATTALQARETTATTRTPATIATTVATPKASTRFRANNHSSTHSASHTSSSSSSSPSTTTAVTAATAANGQMRIRVPIVGVPPARVLSPRAGLGTTMAREIRRMLLTEGDGAHSRGAERCGRKGSWGGIECKKGREEHDASMGRQKEQRADDQSMGRNWEGDRGSWRRARRCTD